MSGRQLPHRRSKQARIVLIATIGLAIAAGLIAARHDPPRGHAETGLFTTLPILWSEATDPGELLAPTLPHWALREISDGGRVRPLDLLAGPPGREPLAGLADLVIAQPRPLSPQENVALDDWVRSGGHLLLFADPALTEGSRFALGDPRRPPAGVLLSPILRRWGLELQFDDGQPFGERDQAWAGFKVPVNLPGQFRTVDPGRCRIDAGGLLAHCRIGRGEVTAWADAAVLERDDPRGQRRRAFAALVDAAFVPR